MTIDEFNKTGWTGGMNGEYKGENYPIASCDFEEKTIALVGVIADSPDELTWVRCESVQLA